MNLFAHWWRRIVRGRVVSESDTDSGDLLREYRSGYIEHIDRATGRKTDVIRDLHRRRFHPRTWRCSRVNGGGIVEYERVTRDEAVSRCSQELGAVIYVDDMNGFLFYRDGSGVAGTLPNNVTPQ